MASTTDGKSREARCFASEVGLELFPDGKVGCSSLASARHSITAASLDTIPSTKDDSPSPPPVGDRCDNDDGKEQHAGFDAEREGAIEQTPSDYCNKASEGASPSLLQTYYDKYDEDAAFVSESNSILLSASSSVCKKNGIDPEHSTFHGGPSLSEADDAPDCRRDSREKHKHPAIGEGSGSSSAPPSGESSEREEERAGVVGLGTAIANGIDAAVVDEEENKKTLAKRADGNKCTAFEGGASSSARSAAAADGTKAAGQKALPLEGVFASGRTAAEGWVCAVGSAVDRNITSAARCGARASVERRSRVGGRVTALLTTTQRAARSRAAGAEDLVRCCSARSVAAACEAGTATGVVAAEQEVQKKLAAKHTSLQMAAAAASARQSAKRDARAVADTVLKKATASTRAAANKVKGLTVTVADGTRDVTLETCARLADMTEVAAKRAAAQTAKMARDIAEAMETLADESKDIAKDFDKTVKEVTSARERLVEKREAFIDRSMEGKIYTFYDGIEASLVEAGVLSATKSFASRARRRESGMHSFDDDDASMGTGYTSAYSGLSAYSMEFSEYSARPSQSVHHGADDLPKKSPTVVRFDDQLPIDKEQQAEKEHENNEITVQKSGGDGGHGGSKNETKRDSDQNCKISAESEVEQRNDNPTRTAAASTEARREGDEFVRPTGILPFEQRAEVLDELKSILRESKFSSNEQHGGVGKSIILASKKSSFSSTDITQKKKGVPLSPLVNGDSKSKESSMSSNTVQKGLKHRSKSLGQNHVAVMKKKPLARKQVSMRKHVGIKTSSFRGARHHLLSNE